VVIQDYDIVVFQPIDLHQVYWIHMEEREEILPQRAWRTRREEDFCQQLRDLCVLRGFFFRSVLFVVKFFFGEIGK